MMSLSGNITCFAESLEYFPASPKIRMRDRALPVITHLIFCKIGLGATPPQPVRLITEKKSRRVAPHAMDRAAQALAHFFSPYWLWLTAIAMLRAMGLKE